MALKVDYVVRETAINLKRNFTLTAATVITIALTLSFVGAFFLAQKGVDRANVKFKGNVQFVLFMKPDAAPSQIESVGRTLNETPQVKSTRYLSHDEAFSEFKELFADKPEFVQNIVAADLPTSYKVTLKDGSSAIVLSLIDTFKQQPGVLDIAAAPKAVKKQEDGFAKIKVTLAIGAVVVGLASLVLVVNSIRIAMFARRREIEVMKLVGATNWFIRIPFMFEGLLQGIGGAIIGILIVWTVKGTVLPTLIDAGGIFTGFKLESSDLFTASIYLMIAGALVGVIASAVAATRYLDV